MNYLIGIDVGTQALRAVLFTTEGEKIFETSESYPTHHVAPGRVEQDPEQWWTALVECLRRTASAVGD